MVSKWVYARNEYPHMAIGGLQKLMSEGLNFSDNDKEQVMAGVAPDWGTLTHQSKVAFIHWIND